MGVAGRSGVCEKRGMLQAITIPGLLVTGTDTGVGKTVVAGAIAQWFLRRGMVAGVCKPVATGCRHEREQLVSADAEFLASCADSRHPLDIICPQRYAEPLAPSVAARRAGQPLDWAAIDRSIQLMCIGCQAIIVEGIGGVLTPLDELSTVLHMAHWLQIPAIVVARPGLGTINHTLLTIMALRTAGVPVAGVVINRYPADMPSVAEETNPAEIEKYGKIPVLCIVPEDKVRGPSVPVEIAEAVEMVDWARIAGFSAGMLNAG